MIESVPWRGPLASSAQFDRLLGPVGLTRKQWTACILVALSVVVVSEVRKLLLGRGVPETVAEEELAEAPAVPTGS